MWYLSCWEFSQGWGGGLFEEIFFCIVTPRERAAVSAGLSPSRPQQPLSAFWSLETAGKLQNFLPLTFLFMAVFPRSSLFYLFLSFLFFTHFYIFKNRFYLFIYMQGREGEREGEKHQCVVASHTPPTGDLAHNPGMGPDWELNQRPSIH